MIPWPRYFDAVGAIDVWLLQAGQRSVPSILSLTAAGDEEPRARRRLMF
jgi:hypothetical protein